MWKYIGQGNKRDVQGGEWQIHDFQQEYDLICQMNYL